MKLKQRRFLAALTAMVTGGLMTNTFPIVPDHLQPIYLAHLLLLS
jgi:hypothetical protein